jgi:hypothetical protein
MTDIFGAIRLADDLEDAVLATLEKWWPVYVAELELQSPADTDDPKHIEPGALPPPKAWVKANQLDRAASDNLPAIVVVSPGMSGRAAPKQEGDGTFRAFFSIGVGVFVSADQRSNTMRLVRLYTAIVRTILLQRQSLDGFADGTTWLDESYDDNFTFTDDQTISAGQVVFEIELSGVVNRYGGPAVYGGPPPDPDPDTQPGSDWPLVAEASATVEVKES